MPETRWTGPGGDAGCRSLLASPIANCRRCPRLMDYLDGFASEENRRVPDCDYWARPVPGFGDTEGEFLIIGLAPGAHGANRTGRPFTGDAAGELLYRALYRHGFSNKPAAQDRQDGLRLRNVYITNAVKCAPPGNRPTGEEKRNCLDWLGQELSQLSNVRLVLAMGRDAFDAYGRMVRRAGEVLRPQDRTFGHGEVRRISPRFPVLLASYHFSRYNVNTGLLTESMVDDLFDQVSRLLQEPT